MPSNKLELVGLSRRAEIIPFNTYNNTDESKKYGVTHTRAKSDTETPDYGRGTGLFLDTYNGGNNIDINGNPSLIGSGRKQNLALNLYNQDNGYKTPDTSANIGMVKIG